jgi:hypothetical protein
MALPDAISCHIFNASDNLEVHVLVPLCQKAAGVGARSTRTKPRADECVRPYTNICLRAAAGAAAAAASVAAAVSGHDAAAEAAAWGVSQVDEA